MLRLAERLQLACVCAVAAAGAAAAAPEDREAFFGDLHVHTWWSFDAYAMGVRVGPEEAYRYARGRAIDHVSGSKIRLAGPPLDFIALTEHSEYMGVSALTSQPGHPIHELPLIRSLTSDDPAQRSDALSRFADILTGSEAIPELLTDDIVKPVWRRIVELADEQDEPGVFTALVGYEWSAMPEGQNLHRNVLFAGSEVPERPFSSVDSANPEDLWRWMDRVRRQGSDVIAIPHNANASNGLMYARTDTAGNPMDGRYAELRLRNEPVSEIFQIKGQSETHPVLSPDDEWAGFEQFDRILGRMTEASEPSGSFVRDALRKGLEMSRDGFNPYRIGVIGSSDGHNASSPVEEENYSGKIGMVDGTPRQRMLEAISPALPVDAVSRWGAAGLAGVWADANNRREIFAALRRRETFATSGPRIRARFFGGLTLTADHVATLVESGYRLGVPMGGQVRAGPGRPGFLFWALQEPDGAGLERAQIIKLWADADGSHERVIDVACSDGSAPAGGRCPRAVAEPDGDCEPEPAAAELRGYWQDETYDPAEPTAYYLRVIQAPTCRWSTYDAAALSVEVPAHLPRTIRERAVTSAIWFGTLPKTEVEDR